ncbi:MAG: GTPase HflX [Peptostreptococcaceae bacterium]|nr:GTPase HflX [Peptostreptococcaceae bacterium]
MLVGIDGMRMTELPINESMNELQGLCEAAGAVVIDRVTQKREKPDPAFFIGKGKVDEIRSFAEGLEVDIIIFNNELTGSQVRNLEEVIGKTVIDRTILILDIFALRATTRQAKLQVELAQLKYRLPRLRGMGNSLSRTGAGIGTRGPGEQKLETDRRHIMNRVAEIRRQIRKIDQVRQVQKKKRTENEIPMVAFVGYTNAGKSSLMNYFIERSLDEEILGTKVYEEDMLFATLDTSTRRMEMEKGKVFVLTDTVGFVSDLPHMLVEAFKSTLEEVLDADLLVNVVDASNPDYLMQKDTTNRVLKELGVSEKIPEIVVYNKMDLVEDGTALIRGIEETLNISAKTGLGIDGLMEKIHGELFQSMVKVWFLIPFDKGGVYSELKERHNVLETIYEENGTKAFVELSRLDVGRYREFLIVKEEE